MVSNKKRFKVAILLAVCIGLLSGCIMKEEAAENNQRVEPTPESVEVQTGGLEQSASEQPTESVVPFPENYHVVTNVRNVGPEPTEPPYAPVDMDGGFQVQGTKLLDANGNEFVFRGVNHAHTWYKDYDKTAIPAIAATGSNTVRIVFANGIQWSKDDAATLRQVIELCKQNGLIVIAEVHDGTGSDSIETLEKITDYWIEMKDVLIGNEAYVILNIANEWVGQWNSELWRDGYVSVIPRLREAGITNTILVDSAGWGQYGKCLADYGKEVLMSDPLQNTMFAVHMYGTAGGKEETIRENLEGAIRQELCVCVGEFGQNHSDGDVKEDYIMRYCTENQIGYLGWSWKGNSGGVEYLDIALEWNGSRLSNDWGEILINGPYGIRETSKICSVFK